MTDFNSNNKTVVEIRNLTMSFDGRNVLSNIDLTLERDKNLVVLGKSGTGKTILLKCIIGLLQPDSGIIKVFGTDIQQLNEFALNEMRKKLGYLFQNGALYDSMTLEENLWFPLNRIANELNHAEKSELVYTTLDSVGLLEAAKKMPTELSGGMRKRGGLARTLVLRPKIILYDEPTTGLDPFTAKEISELILEIREKYDTSSIIVTHDMNCAKVTADNIIILENGEIVARGSFHEIELMNTRLIQGFFNN